MIHSNLVILVAASIAGCSGLPSVSLKIYPITDYDQFIINKELFVKCGETDYVRLPSKKLDEIPDDLVNSDTIKSIFLAKNEITEVGRDAFEGAPNLECVDLSKNRIMLNRLKIQHKGLKTLILDDQENLEVDMLSNEIENSDGSEALLPNLKTLSLSGAMDVSERNLRFLANALPNLENIYLTGSNIWSDVSAKISAYFPRIKRVYLGQSKSDFLDINDFGTVEELYMDNILFRYLFVSSNITSLRVLSLANCSLSEPDKMNSTSLKSLDLSRNLVSNIDANMFEDMLSLENLNLGYNQLREVPYFVYLNRLRQLSLNYNFITEFLSMNMPNSLRVLSLKGNRLTTIDKVAFSNLNELEALDLSENRLQSLPDGWDANLKMLGHLNLRSNKFINIQSMRIQFLPNLEEFYVKGNNFDSIDSNSLQQLPDKCTVYTF